MLGGWIAQKMLVVKRLAQGFAVMALALGVSNVVALIATDHVWLGLVYFLVLVIPLSASIFLIKERLKHRTQTISVTEKLASLLFVVQGAALACWSFDNATTFYAIDVARVATEMNPLGWPLGAFGALVYYVPTIILTFVLLFEFKQKMAVYTAVAMTTVALAMGFINLSAGMINFKIFLTFATPSVPVALQSNILLAVAAVDLVYAVTFATFARKQSLNQQQKLGSIKKP